MQADKQAVTRLIRTARGQLDGVLRMIEEDRYCLDIAGQLMAAQAILKKANREVLQAHLEHCVAEAADSQNAREKIAELVDIFDKMTR